MENRFSAEILLSIITVEIKFVVIITQFLIQIYIFNNHKYLVDIMLTYLISNPV